jgi:hypothetical protein
MAVKARDHFGVETWERATMQFNAVLRKIRPAL